MGMFLTEKTVWSRALRVVVDGDPGLPQGQNDIGLAHAEDSDFSECLVPDQQVAQRINGVFVPHCRHFREPLALKRHKLRILDDGNQDRLGAGNRLPFVVPAAVGGKQIFANAGTGNRVLQTLDQPGVASVMCPRRNECGKGVEPGGVCIGIGTDVHASGAS